MAAASRRAAVSSVVESVDAMAARDQSRHEVRVPAAVLADAVDDEDNRPRRFIRQPALPEERKAPCSIERPVHVIHDGAHWMQAHISPLPDPSTSVDHVPPDPGVIPGTSDGRRSENATGVAPNGATPDPYVFECLPALMCSE